jgi:hypothetical protein
MVGVVQANGNELGHLRHGAAHARLAAHQGQLVSFEFGQFGQNFVGQLSGANIGYHATQITQLASGVNQARFFFAGRAEANEFHERFLELN